MESLQIRILQGSNTPYPPSDINIVIDVIRAFTVSQIAFMRGAKEIMLVNFAEEAFALKKLNPELLLAGEIKGLPIAGFDLDNSPHTFSNATLSGRTLVQKTSNGVKATLLAMNTQTLLVTGFANARNTALYARKLAEEVKSGSINIIASHEGDDDDLSCAEYIQDQLLELGLIPPESVCQRIRKSRPAQKFYNSDMADFDVRDMEYCSREIACDFIMQVDTRASIPCIRKIPVSFPQYG